MGRPPLHLLPFYPLHCFILAPFEFPLGCLRFAFASLPPFPLPFGLPFHSPRAVFGALSRKCTFIGLLSLPFGSFFVAPPHFDGLVALLYVFYTSLPTKILRRGSIDGQSRIYRPWPQESETELASQSNHISLTVVEHRRNKRYNRHGSHFPHL